MPLQPPLLARSCLGLQAAEASGCILEGRLEETSSCHSLRVLLAGDVGPRAGHDPVASSKKPAGAQSMGHGAPAAAAPGPASCLGLHAADASAWIMDGILEEIASCHQGTAVWRCGTLGKLQCFHCVHDAATSQGPTRISSLGRSRPASLLGLQTAEASVRLTDSLICIYWKRRHHATCSGRCFLEMMCPGQVTSSRDQPGPCKSPVFGP